MKFRGDFKQYTPLNAKQRACREFIHFGAAYNIGFFTSRLRETRANGGQMRNTRNLSIEYKGPLFECFSAGASLLAQEYVHN